MRILFFLLFFVCSQFLFAVKNPCDIDTIGSRDWMIFLKKGKYKVIDSAKVEVSSTSEWDPRKYDKLIREDYLGVFSFHTKKEKNPYVILDLKKIKTVGAIMIINRADRVGRRTTNLNIDFSKDKKKWKNVYYAVFAQDSWEVIFKNPPKTRYVKVWLNKTEYLHLAQILVYVKK